MKEENYSDEFSRQMQNFREKKFHEAAAMEWLQFSLMVQSISDLDLSHKLDMDDEIPFLLVVPDVLVSIPKQLQLISGCDWRQRFPNWQHISSRMYFQRHVRMVLGVEIHEPNESEEGSEWRTAMRLFKEGKIHMDAAEGCALALHRPDIIDRHRSIGLFESAASDFEVPFLDRRSEKNLDNVPPEMLHFSDHHVGKNSRGGAKVAVCRNRLANIGNIQFQDLKSRRRFRETAFHEVMVEWPAEKERERTVTAIMEK